jgi:hypothetical protein
VVKVRSYLPCLMLVALAWMVVSCSSGPAAEDTAVAQTISTPAETPEAPMASAELSTPVRRAAPETPAPSAAPTPVAPKPATPTPATPPAVTPAPTVTPTPPPAASTASKIPHAIEGRSNCLVCHKTGVGKAKAVPANHAGRTNDQCQTCHEPSQK